ncbi:tetratricopeptide repeat protein [Bernardetia sp. OM2101]|uniref:tetratricopeptide repeat protein n=1 Tax=Bernardetia sp. OM2101 TaxID=3344876 RepID=UPI0035D1216C
MKLYEIVVIALFIITIILQFFKIDINFTSFSLLVSNTLLSLSYFVGGYWVLRNKEKTNTIISIFGGLVFGVALIGFWTRIMIVQNAILFYLPFLNVLFFVILSILFFVKKNETDFVKSNKLILIRSFIILLFTCFFFYTPVYFSPYNDLIRAMNINRDWLQHNLNMAKYHTKAGEEIEKENYEKAIEYALKAELEGRKGFKFPDYPLFLGPGEVDTTFLKGLDLVAMNAMYSRLYSAYNHLANHNNNIGKTEEALKNYTIAHKFLMIYNLNNGFWEKENIISFANIANTLSYMGRYEQANEYFDKAIQLTKSLDNLQGSDITYAYILLGNSLTKQQLYEEANEKYSYSIEVNLRDSLNDENRTSIAGYYSKIALNYAKLAESDQAIQSFEKAFFYETNKESEIYIQNLFYYGFLHFQLHEYEKAESILSETIQLYENIEINEILNIAECKALLSQINRAVGKYEYAEKNIKEALTITKNNFTKVNAHYVNYLSIYASLNLLLSNYEMAEKQYEEALKINRELKNESNYEEIELLSQLADVYINQYKQNKAAKYVNEATQKYQQLNETITEFDDINNKIAYINYAMGNNELAKTIYEKIVGENLEYSSIKSNTVAITLNGIGLVEIENKKYVKADSLFHYSLRMYKDIFKKPTPSLATVHLNMAKLYVYKREVDNAKNHIDEAFKINATFFDKNHINFGEIEVTYADLAALEKNKQKEKTHLQEALSIYSNKFEEDNTRVQYLKERIESTLK